MSRANTIGLILDRIILQEPDRLETGCWGYPGAPNSKGYHKARLNGRWVLIHRVVYGCLRGVVPADKELHHRCLNSECCNPDHLELLTTKQHLDAHQNNLSSISAAVTHCPQGHEYSVINTHVTPKGHRVCRACKRDRMERNRRYQGIQPTPNKSHRSYGL